MTSITPLKITLRVSQPPSTDSNASSPKSTSNAGSPRATDKHKRAKPNPRRRQVKPSPSSTPASNATVPLTTTTSQADTPTSTATDGNGTLATNTTNDEGQTRTTSRPVTSIRKEILKIKDTHARSWERTPLVFHTLGGYTVTVPSSWQTKQAMTLNKRTTEPTTMAEIDKLYSTANEKDFRPFLCTQPGCSKAFTSFDQLQTHENNMHGAKKQVCGIDGCHKSFATPGQLTKHRKMVHFRAARKAKLAAAAQAEREASLAAEQATPGADTGAASEAETDATPAATTPSVAADDMMDGRDEDSVDIGNTED